MTTVKIIPFEEQNLTQEMKTEIRAAFDAEYRMWKEDGQKYLSGNYELSLSEKIEKGKDTEYISIGMMKDGKDAGYLHVYGYSEVLEK